MIINKKDRVWLNTFRCTTSRSFFEFAQASDLSDADTFSLPLMFANLSEKTKVLCRELAQVREHRCQQVRIQSAPTRQSSTVLIY